ncbi:hypothetical protein B0H14DRAFT_2748369, partial [Mycena olivaceomarginata]
MLPLVVASEIVDQRLPLDSIVGSQWVGRRLVIIEILFSDPSDRTIKGSMYKHPAIQAMTKATVSKTCWPTPSSTRNCSMTLPPSRSTTTPHQTSHHASRNFWLSQSLYSSVWYVHCSNHRLLPLLATARPVPSRCLSLRANSKSQSPKKHG